MTDILSDAGPGTAPAAFPGTAAARAHAMLAAAAQLLPTLETGEPITTARLRTAMTNAFGASDAEGAWVWKTAYDVCEAAQILFLRRFGPAMLARGERRALALIERVATLLPTHTRRSEAGQALQQFSTPAGLSYVAAVAASIGAGETLLEPSAGTGMLAIHAELAGAQLVLNELADTRAELLTRLFADVPVTRHDAASIDDRLPEPVRPSVILMNPPFSAAAHVDRKMKDAALRHITFSRIRGMGWPHGQ